MQVGLWTSAGAKIDCCTPSVEQCGRTQSKHVCTQSSLTRCCLLLYSWDIGCQFGTAHELRDITCLPLWVYSPPVSFFFLFPSLFILLRPSATAAAFIYLVLMYQLMIVGTNSLPQEPLLWGVLKKDTIQCKQLCYDAA